MLAADLTMCIYLSALSRVTQVSNVVPIAVNSLIALRRVTNRNMLSFMFSSFRYATGTKQSKVSFLRESNTL